MATFDYKLIKRTSQRDKDIVYGFMKQMQSMFTEIDNPYYTIVQLIQDLCLLYFHQTIDTNILTDDEQHKLIEMVNHHTNNKYDGEWRLLFRSTRDGLKRDDFYSKCDGINNSICVIQTKENNVFGGFTSLYWDKSKCKNYPMDHEDDPSAFIYIIRSQKGYKPEIIGVKNNGRRAVQHYTKGYLSFGEAGSAFYIDQYANDTAYLYAYSDAIEYGLDLRTEKLNDIHGFNSSWSASEPTEVEVFQL